MSGRWLTIVGIGEDGVSGLSAAARDAIGRAALVVGGARHLALADALIRGERRPWPSPMDAALPDICARRPALVVVLASGDPHWFGVGTMLARAVPVAETLCLPAPSAFAWACARLGWALQACETLSLCGRPVEALAAVLRPGARVLALSADAATPAAVAALLCAQGFGASVVHVLEALGGPDERLRSGAAASFAVRDIHPLNMLAIEVIADPGGRARPLSAGLPEDWFEHDGQITKAEVRAVTLSALAPRRGELLWDVGCGSGAVGIEWMRHHPANRAIGVDRDSGRAARAARNAVALGVPGLRVAHGDAPGVLGTLPRPDAVFIGCGAYVAGLLDAVWAALPPDGRLVANAVTIESEGALLAFRAAVGGALTRLSVERLDVVGRLHGFRPAMTVTQFRAVKP